ncbi:MAG: hypothetical protein ACYC0H_09065 [Solirubrobacteraceae bacterium]
MNSDLTPGRPGARDDTSARPGATARWRAAANLHADLFADAGEPTPARGEIWSLRHTERSDEELLLAVIIATGPEAATVVPLSTDTNQATEWDLLLPTQTLGYRVIAQPKLAGTAARARLERRVSALMPESRRDLEQLVDAANAGRALPPEPLPVGPWVLSERDPRLAARARAAQHARMYLSLLHEDPSAEWQSLGSILTRGARATGIDLATVVEPRWTTRLQADQLNPFAMLPPRRMAELLRTLRIGWSDRVRDAVYRLASQFAPSEVAQGTVFGRRQGTRGRRRSPPSSSQRASADAASDYVAAVERELGER